MRLNDAPTRFHNICWKVSAGRTGLERRNGSEAGTGGKFAIAIARTSAESERNQAAILCNRRETADRLVELADGGSGGTRLCVANWRRIKGHSLACRRDITGGSSASGVRQHGAWRVDRADAVALIWNLVTADVARFQHHVQQH